MKVIVGAKKMRKRKNKSNSLKGSYLIAFLVFMIVFMIVIISGAFAKEKEQLINRLDSTIIAESTKPPSKMNSQLVSQEGVIEINYGMMTLIGILMVGIGCLLTIKRLPDEDEGKENISTKVEDVIDGEIKNKNEY